MLFEGERGRGDSIERVEPHHGGEARVRYEVGELRLDAGSLDTMPRGGKYSDSEFWCLAGIIRAWPGLVIPARPSNDYLGLAGPGYSQLSPVMVGLTKGRWRPSFRARFFWGDAPRPKAHHRTISETKRPMGATFYRARSTRRNRPTDCSTSSFLQVRPQITLLRDIDLPPHYGLMCTMF